MVQYQYIVDNSSPTSSTTRNHYHSCYELVYYFQGSGQNNYLPLNSPQEQKILVYDTKTKGKKLKRFDVCNNSFIVYKPYTVHNEILKGASEVFAIVFVAPKDLEIDNCLLDDYDGSIAKNIEKIRKEYARKKYGYNMAINALLTQIIVKIKRRTLGTQSENPSIQEAVSYLDDYYTTEIDIPKLAASIGYSLDHFRFLFKKQTGLSPKKYILQKRLSYAKNQLSGSDLPLSEIAESCGYSDYYQFSTYFKKEEGISPIQYKKSHNKPL